MTALQNKTILVISPQAWGNMLLAKHHYAMSLAERGNKVFFLNPAKPGIKFKNTIRIERHPRFANLNLITHNLFFPYSIKFHWKRLYYSLIRFHIKAIMSKIGGTVDIIWSFDVLNSYPLRLFPKSAFKIFHPVDEPSSQLGIEAASGARVIFSVTNEILLKYEGYKVPRIFVNHGLAEDFLQAHQSLRHTKEGISVGLSGNWMRPDVDHACLLQIIDENPEVKFRFWGAYKNEGNNIGTNRSKDVQRFIDGLKARPNVYFEGVVSSLQLKKGFLSVDAFLICYDIQKDQSKGTNYHKVIEYLSAGKVIVSNNISTYEGKDSLVKMIKERDNNHKLPALFKEVISNLDFYNSPVLTTERIAFATDNSYAKQILRIENYIRSL